MTLASWYFSMRDTRRLTRTRARRNRPRAFNRRASFEALEDRCLMSAGALDPTFGSGGLVVAPDITAAVNRELIIASAARHHLPAVYPFRYFAASGGLTSYGIDSVDLFQRAASYVNRILRGENPGDLPVQAPVKFAFVINPKTAKALGLEIPPQLLARADEVIE